MSSCFEKHPFHLVEIRPWPLRGAVGCFILTSGWVFWFRENKTLLASLGFIVILLVIIQWWRDVVRERTYQGFHTNRVFRGIKRGILLFIVSEVFFFFSFFWAFFHRSLSPTLELGLIWPPLGILSFNPWEIPLLNTLVLLSSGVTVTWCHHGIIIRDELRRIVRLALTCILGVYFTFLQALEYIEASFSLADSVYGSVFFVATGFHGLHVLIGTLFLIVSFYRIASYHYNNSHHFGFEAAAWYWHFVDVVWLFLYVFIYWWGR